MTDRPAGLASAEESEVDTRASLGVSTVVTQPDGVTAGEIAEIPVYGEFNSAPIVRGSPDPARPLTEGLPTEQSALAPLSLGRLERKRSQPIMAYCRDFRGGYCRLGGRHDLWRFQVRSSSHASHRRSWRCNLFVSCNLSVSTAQDEVNGN